MPEVDEQQYGVSRLVAFSDGVFGFAITLLITTIPFFLEGLSSSASDEQIWPRLLSLLPNVYSYILSFYIIGNYWIVHHRMLRYIVKFDSLLLWINLTLLLFIVFLPVPTSFLGRYENSSIITALYAVTQTLITLTYVIMLWYASSHHRLILPSLDQKAITYAKLRGLIPLFILAFSIVLAFFSPLLAKLSWIAVFFIRPLVLSHYRQQAP